MSSVKVFEASERPIVKSAIPFTRLVTGFSTKRVIARAILSG